MDVKVAKSLLMTALITGSVLWEGTAAFAEESVGEFELDPMVVTAQRMEKRDLDTPAAVDVISREQVERTGGASAYEVLRQWDYPNLLEKGELHRHNWNDRNK